MNEIELSIVKKYDFFGDFKHYELFGNGLDSDDNFARGRICKIKYSPEDGKHFIKFFVKVSLEANKQILKFIEKNALTEETY